VLDLIWRGFNPNPALRPRIEEFLECEWMSAVLDEDCSAEIEYV
jgi:hypothetical protein